jgi:hypothetical protein
MPSYPAADRTLPHRSPRRFFLLVAALSVPFAWLGASGRALFPGIPISALAFVCPVTAASLLRYREDGAAVVREAVRIISLLLASLAVLVVTIERRIPARRSP